MSENQENLKKDIKPVRPDASSSRLPRRTKGTVSLFSGVLTILNLVGPVSYTHLRAHETKANRVCRLRL